MMTDVTEVARRARKKMADAVPAIIKDVCELDGYTSPDDNPDLLQCTVQQLELILWRHLCGEGITELHEQAALFKHTAEALHTQLASRGITPVLDV